MVLENFRKYKLIKLKKRIYIFYPYGRSLLSSALGKRKKSPHHPSPSPLKLPLAALASLGAISLASISGRARGVCVVVSIF